MEPWDVELERLLTRVGLIISWQIDKKKPAEEINTVIERALGHLLDVGIYSKVIELMQKEKEL